MLCGNGGRDSEYKSLMDDAGRVAIDWNIVLRMGTKWYDRIVEAQRKPTWTERQKARKQLDSDIRNKWRRPGNGLPSPYWRWPIPARASPSVWGW